MRYAFGLVALLVAMAVVLILSARQTKHDFDAARQAIPSLREAVAPAPFDALEAAQTASRLESMLDSAPLPHDELRDITARTAAWAAATQPGGEQYHAAVALRGAADELITSSRDAASPRRARARQLIAEAREALRGTTAMPGGPAGAIRDQLKNLQYSQQEKLGETEREAH